METKSLTTAHLVAASFIVLATSRVNALTVYSNDFQSAAGGEWSSSAIATAPLPGDGSRRFLGRFANGTVSLSLAGLPIHAYVTVEFDLYVIQSWDGDGPEGGTPDRWTVGANGGPVLLLTTFSNFPGRTQDYPGPYDAMPNATNLPKTGASESNTLGYPGFLDFPGGDSVYHLTFTFPHTSTSLSLDFTGGPGLTSVADESWGLDNVFVSVASCAPSPLSCLSAEKSVLLLKNNVADDTKDKLVWKWLKGAETMFGDLGDPTSSTNYTLCLYAGTSSSVAILAGSNWQAVETKGFKFKDKSGTPDGAQKALLKSGAAGKAKVLVKGKGGNLPDTLVPALPLPVTAQSVNDTNSTCFEAVYDSGDVKKNDAKQFKAKAQ